MLPESVSEMITEKVAVFDTTLRDGEQAAGTRLGSREKLIIARQLANLRVDVIEAGYPASSPEDFESVQLIGREITGPAICGLSRAIPADIEACARALAHCPRPRIHTGIGASDIHIMGKFRDERYGRELTQKRSRILEMAVDAVRLARQFADDVEFYAEDAGRADGSFLLLMIAAVVDAGATVVNIPDTTGYAVPEQYGALIAGIRAAVGERAVVSVHCHDDLGLAVANTLAGVANGARQVEGTINGVGERAGNAALEEIIMALRTRVEYFAAHTDVDTRELQKTSRLVADLLGIQTPPNKAVVGANAFSHSSGIHVDGVLKQRETYEIMRPEDVGVLESRVVLTARTGRHGLRDRLAKLGYPLVEAELDQAYQRFLSIADKKREVFDEDLLAIVHDEIHAPGTYKLEYLQIYSGTSAIPTATVRVRVNEEVREGAAVGDGPVDAVCRAISQVTGAAARLERYEIRAVTSGTEAMGEVTVQLEESGHRVVGRGASTDVIEASAKAYIEGLNQLARRVMRSAT
jgi:2-isopropylmalate synthase